MDEKGSIVDDEETIERYAIERQGAPRNRERDREREKETQIYFSRKLEKRLEERTKHHCLPRRETRETERERDRQMYHFP